MTELIDFAKNNLIFMGIVLVFLSWWTIGFPLLRRRSMAIASRIIEFYATENQISVTKINSWLLTGWGPYLRRPRHSRLLRADVTGEGGEAYQLWFIFLRLQVFSAPRSVEVRVSPKSGPEMAFTCELDKGVPTKLIPS